MTDVPDLLRELNDAVEKQDWATLTKLLHPDVVWRHNIGVGSPEEGEYTGREDVIALYGRITDPWESMRAVPTEVREVEGGTLAVKGELHAKHRATETEVVTPYVMRLEIRAGLLTRGEMVTGPRAGLPEPEAQ